MNTVRAQGVQNGTVKETGQVETLSSERREKKEKNAGEWGAGTGSLQIRDS